MAAAAYLAELAVPSLIHYNLAGSWPLNLGKTSHGVWKILDLGYGINKELEICRPPN